MKFLKASLILFLLWSACTSTGKLSYPGTRKDEVNDDYFGTTVSDPYRWLEDDRSEETAEWVKEQNAVTFKYLEEIPYRDKIKARLTEIWNYPRFSPISHYNGHYFYYKNDGLQNQSVLYIMDSPDGSSKVFIDPNKLSESGTVSLSAFSVSSNGKYAAYGTSSS